MVGQRLRALIALAWLALSQTTLAAVGSGGVKADCDAALTVTIDRVDLEKTMMGAVPFDDQIESGKAKLDGKREVYDQLKTMLVQFDLGFELMPGTGAKDLTPEKKPFEQELPADTSGG
jgi:hypothetical protein